MLSVFQIWHALHNWEFPRYPGNPFRERYEQLEADIEELLEIYCDMTGEEMDGAYVLWEAEPPVYDMLNTISADELWRRFWELLFTGLKDSAPCDLLNHAEKVQSRCYALLRRSHGTAHRR